MRILPLVSFLVGAANAKAVTPDCQHASALKQPRISVSETKLWASIGRFGHSLLKQTALSENTGENVLISPLSVHSALSKVALGVSGSGKQQLQKALHTDAIKDAELVRTYSRFISRQDNDTDKFIIRLANRLYVNKSVSVVQSYVDLVNKNFHAEVANVNFAIDGERIRKGINEFVYNKTHRLIPHILQKPLPNDTMMVLLNVLYFRGKWANPMGAEIRSLAFNRHCDQFKKMHKEWISARLTIPYLLSTKLQAQLFSLPYESTGDYTTSLLIIMPMEDHSCSIKKWLHSISWNNMRKEIGRMAYEDVYFKMPRFEVDYRTEMRDALGAMGINGFFEKPDFSGMISTNQQQNMTILVYKVIHQMKLIVNQYGIEATGTSVAQVMPVSMPKVDVTIDRSFYMAVLYKHRESNMTLPIISSLIVDV
ncbi:leukocyte elastase inhibitor-like [Varroa destructor]|uniref:Serpin domain-containing protein n=1 Tax=Varroa destructor TaxID=109461 RepID=A0A7M7KV63_VARDE|nr:leukocyte elastase inhibitor-like [Varroa destructor]XP_022670229.1 leukocyte elastase inhibitor-like [Varroa destructor]